MRQIILDTETTGLDPRQGHRIIEIGAVEMINRQLTGRHFHHYLYPDREIDPGAQEVHGISLEFLQGKPRFKDIVDEFIDYVRDAELIIHNAPFDVGFINAELALLDKGALADYAGNVLDTLKMAKELRPGKRNNLNVLCDVYEVDNSGRKLHGALLDSELLAEVYLAMTRGQESLAIEIESPVADQRSGDGLSSDGLHETEQDLCLIVASEEELAAHEALLNGLDKACGGTCLWRREENNAANA